MSLLKPYLKLIGMMIVVPMLALIIAWTVNVKLVVLWTDALIYILIISIFAFAIQAQHKEHLRAPWRHVVRRRLAMSAFVILIVYVIVGLLDSIHYREALEQQEGQTERHYSGEVLSLLDALTAPLRRQQEKTYSAPFATHLYMKEIVERDGKQVREYPRLKYD